MLNHSVVLSENPQFHPPAGVGAPIVLETGNRKAAARIEPFPPRRVPTKRLMCKTCLGKCCVGRCRF